MQAFGSGLTVFHGFGDSRVLRFGLGLGEFQGFRLGSERVRVVFCNSGSPVAQIDAR